MSRWLEIIPIVSKDTKLIIKNLKPIFARFGIPQTVIADNNPFNSVEFKEFSRSWSFDIITTSPNYSKSNGLAEKGVDIAKNMLKKCQDSNSDINLCLLDYRNSCVAGLKVSPAQLIMNRMLRTRLPVEIQTLKPSIPVVNIDNRSKQADQYNINCKTECVYKEGEKILFQKAEKGSWMRGVIVSKANTLRSYLIKDNNGVVYRRNTHHLKKKNKI